MHQFGYSLELLHVRGGIGLINMLKQIEDFVTAVHRRLFMIYYLCGFLGETAPLPSFVGF